MLEEKFIIDTDPGVDDAIAIFLAFGSRKIKVEALTAVNGNVSLDTALENAKKIVPFSEFNNVSIYKGEDKPLERKVNVDAAWVHGNDGLGGVKLDVTPKKEEEKDAVSYICETIKTSKPKEYSIICLGPLTNIAKAIKKSPNIQNKINRIILMGGAFGGYEPRGNASPYAEYNIFADPHAANIVFNSNINITVVPMEIGRKALATKDYVERIRNSKNKVSIAVADMIDATVKRMGNNGASMYDPTATAFVVKPSIFSGKKGIITVNTDQDDEKFGMTEFFEKKDGNCTLLTKIDTPAFFELLIEACSRLN